MIAPVPRQKILIWFRDDLRLAENAVLEALKKVPEAAVAFVYVYDERWERLLPEGVARIGTHRRRFLIETVRELRANLESKGATLHCFKAVPEEIIPALGEQLGLSAVYFARGFAVEERLIEKKLSARLARLGIETKSFVNQTLYRPEDLPFAIEELPMVFTAYRKSVESFAKPAPMVAAVSRWPVSLELPVDILAKLNPWDIQNDATVGPKAFDFMRGGESAARLRLQHYIWDADRLRQYKITHSGLNVSDDSTKFSPWLANGSLSARQVADEVRRYETSRMNNDSTYWLIFELMWRDYFQFLALKMGNKFFAKDGYVPSARTTPSVKSSIGLDERFNLWSQGQTGFPLVDAGMRQLRETGWMPNQVRQNAASFLVHDLGVDWRKGARWFESFLVDYEPCSNWGNWSYVAGVGTDPRARQFNVVKQSLTYDPNGDYVRTWIPELKDFEGPQALEPWQESLRANVCGYPARMVNSAFKPGYF